MLRKRGTWIAALITLTVAPRYATACAGCFAPDVSVILGAGAAALLPSDVGIAIPVTDAAPTRFVLGWFWQIPIGADGLFRGSGHHRVVPAVDLLPHAGGASVRGRLGYRYGRRHAFGGAAIGIDGDGMTLSPEVGVKFLHVYSNDAIDASLHLLARADIAPDTGHVRGATVLLGWNLF